MSDQKTCPFCLEEIPAKAIKCRYCESMVDDVPPTAVKKPKPAGSAVEPKTKKQEPPKQGYYQPGAGKEKGKRVLVPVIILVVFLFLIGAGAAYWFLFYDRVPVAGALDDGDIIGSWKGTSGDLNVYFQFLPNDMVNVAVPPEGYWFRTQYRLVRAETDSYMELYHRGLTEWERTAQIDFSDDERIIMTDTWAGIRIELERIADSEFRDAINDLRFER